MTLRNVVSDLSTFTFMDNAGITLQQEKYTPLYTYTVMCVKVEISGGPVRGKAISTKLLSLCWTQLFVSVLRMCSIRVSRLLGEFGEVTDVNSRRRGKYT